MRRVPAEQFAAQIDEVVRILQCWEQAMRTTDDAAPAVRRGRPARSAADAVPAVNREPARQAV